MSAIISPARTLDMQSEDFQKAIQGPASQIIVQILKTIFEGLQNKETPVNLANRVIKPSINNEINAAEEMTKQLFAKMMETTYKMAVQHSAKVIVPVLHMMGPELSHQFVATFALPKTIEFEAQFKAPGGL